MDQVVQTTPRTFQLLEFRVVHHLIQLGREALVDFAYPALDVGLHVVGDHLARFHHLVQESPKIRFGARGLAVVLRPGYLDDLIEQAGCFRFGRHGLGSLFDFCSTHDLVSSCWGCDPDEASSTRATAVAFSVFANTSAKSCSSLSLPSMRLRSWVNSCRISRSCLSGPICWATRAGSKSSICLKFNSTANLLLGSVSELGTRIARRGVARASTSLKLSRSMLTALRSLSGRKASLGCPDRSARTPTTKGSS